MTRYLDLAEFFWLAEQVTGLDTTTLVKASRVELADSALHAPQAVDVVAPVVERLRGAGGGEAG